MAAEIIRKLSVDEKDYQEYLAREKYFHDELSKKAYAEHKMKIVTEKAAAEVEAAQKAVEAAEKALKQGIENEILKTRRADIIENLSEFGEIPVSIIDTVNKEISIDLLKKWMKTSLKVDSIDEFISKM